jgi:hypothetical protein
MTYEQSFVRGLRDIVSGSAIRFVAYAGALSFGLLLGGVGGEVAAADPGGAANQDSGGGEQSGKGDTTRNPSTPGERYGSVGITGGSDNRPRSSVGSGRGETAPRKPQPGDEVSKGDGGGTKGDAALHLPTIAQLPTISVPAATLATAINQLPTVVWQQVTVFATFALPNPEPAPQPAMPSIVQQEPVVDSSGGSIQAPDPGAAQPPVLDAPPVVAAMPAVAAAPAGPATPIIANNSWMAPPQSAPGTTEAAVRGSVSATSEPPAANGSTPMGTRASRLGYAEYLRNAKLLELAVVALPGVAGLLMLTVGGGVIGYRQANAGRIVRINGAASFLP